MRLASLTQIALPTDRATSHTPKPLCEIMEEERLLAKRKAISFQKKGCAWYIKVKHKE